MSNGNGRLLLLVHALEASPLDDEQREWVTHLRNGILALTA
jgi:hypothetical protein